MKKIFFGLFFVLINCIIPLGAINLNLLPDVVGFYLIFTGLAEVESYAVQFGKMRKQCKILLPISAGIFIAQLLCLNVSLGIIYSVIYTAYRIFMIYVIFRLVLGAREAENEYHKNTDSDFMVSPWKTMLLCEVLNIVGIIIVMPSMVINIIFTVCALWFIFKFNKMQKLFYKDIYDKKPFEAQLTDEEIKEQWNKR